MSAPGATSPTTRLRPSSFSISGPVLRLFDPFTTAPNERNKEMSAPARSSSVHSSNPPADQPPIVTLKLSGPSFLDTVIRDTVTKQPLYIIETVHDLTSIYRLDNRLNEAGKAAAIQWPPSVTASSKSRSKSGRSVQMGSGSWRDAEDVLKVGALGNLASRKFNLPHYPHTLKWKLVPGNIYAALHFEYLCTCNAVKGPIAILDAAVLSGSPRLRIYETLIPADLVRSQQNHSGVPCLLLDYLITTALLLTTTNQEWLDRPADLRLPGSSSRTVQGWLAIIHSRPLPSGDKPEREVEIADVPPSPTTPHSRRTSSSQWETGTTYSSNSGSGSAGSETILSPTMPSGGAVSARSGSNAFSPSPQQISVPPVPPLPSSQPIHQSQVRFQIANPEPAPSYETSVGCSNHRSPSPQASVASPIYKEAVPTNHPYAYNPVPRPSSVTAVRQPRKLPTPPTMQNATTSAFQELSRVASSPSSIPYSARRNLHGSASQANLMSLVSSEAGSSDSGSDSRAVARRSLRALRSIPQALPPPQQTPLPLPPKLATEYGSGEGSSRSYQQGPPFAMPLPDSGLANDMSSLALSSPPNVGSPPFAPQQFPPAQQSGGSSSVDAGTVHTDAGRVRTTFPHASRDTESVYELPPPAYDAIDFSLRVPGASGRRTRRGG